MMAFLIVAICFLAMWHFIVESIIVPSARAVLRLRLFALRDDLRNLRVSRSASEDEFEEAQRMINNVIRLAPTFDVFAMEQWGRSLKANPEISNRIERRWKHFESIASKPVMDIICRVNQVGLTSLKFNSMGWLIYLVPIFVGVFIWKSISRNFIKITSATEHELKGCPA